MASLGAYYVLSNKHIEFGKLFLKFGIITGIIFSFLQIFPGGDAQGKNVARYQPTSLAAMEGLFKTEEGAELVIIGQPDMEKLLIDNPIKVPKMLSFLTYNRWNAEVKGLNEYPKETWPDNIPLLYYSYHIMVGLGTIFVAIMVIGIILLFLKRIEKAKWFLWILMLSFPFPYIANTAGWMVAELGSTALAYIWNNADKRRNIAKCKYWKCSFHPYRIFWIIPVDGYIVFVPGYKRNK